MFHFRLPAILLALIFLPALLPAVTLEGQVSDPDGAAVPGAKLRLHARSDGSVRATVSQGDGRYGFTSLAPGRYLLEVRALGFDSQSVIVILDDTASESTLDIALRLGTQRTAVVVTAAGTPLQIEEVAKASDSVSIQDITARDEFSIAEGIRLLPGIDVRQQGGPGNLIAIRSRGLRSQDTALLIDGLRVRDAADPQGAPGGLVDILNVTDTASVEVLRGSGSSLYGSHAMAGVINVRGEEGGGPWHGQTITEGGGLGMLRGLARAGGSIGERILLSGGISHLNVRDGVASANPHRNTSGQGYAKWILSPRMYWSGRVTAVTAYTQLADSPSVSTEQLGNLPDSGPVPGRALRDDQVLRVEQGLPASYGDSTYTPSLNDPDFRRAGNLVNLASTFVHDVSSRASWRASYQLSDSQRRFHDGPGGRSFEPVFNNRSDFDGRIHLFQARADVQAVPSQLLTFSFEREHERYSNRNADEDPIAATRTDNTAVGSQQSNSLAVQDQMQYLGGRLRIALSGRLQQFSLSRPRFAGGSSPYAGTESLFDSPPRALTGDAAVAYLAGPSTKLRAHVGNAYRAPALFERFGTSFFFGSFTAFGDPRISPERAVSMDAGIDQWLWTDRLQASATVFYTRLQDTIVFDFSGLIPPDDPFGRFGGYVNTKGGLARGVELSLRGRPRRGTQIQASYTYQNADERVPAVAGSGDLRRLNVSPHLASVLWTQNIGSRLSVTTDLTYASGYPTPIFAGFGSRVFLIEGPLKIDTVADYQLARWETGALHLYGKVENLLNRQFYEAGFRTPQRWALAGLRWQF